MALTVGELGVKLSADIAGFKTAMGAAKESIQSVAIAAGAAAAAFAVVGKRLVESAAKAEEQANLLGVVFEHNARMVEEWAQRQSKSLSRGEGALAGYASGVQAMLGPMLGNIEAATEMSLKLTELAVDVGSLMDREDADVMNAFNSALIGSTGPVRSLGVVMTEASLDAFMLRQGIAGTMKEISESDKVLVRYLFLQESLKKSLGDAAKTAKSYTNSKKALGDAVEDLSRDLGKVLLPAAASVVQTMTGAVQAFRGLSEGTREVIVWIGATTAALAAMTAGTIAAALGWMKLKAVMAPLLPVMAQARTLMATLGIALKGLGAKAGAAILPLLVPIAAVAAALAGLVLIVGSVRQAWDANLVWMQDIARGFVDTVSGWFTTAGKFWGDVFSRAWNAVAGVMRSAWDGITGMVSRLATLIRSSGFGKGVADALDSALARMRTVGVTVSANIDALEVPHFVANVARTAMDIYDPRQWMGSIRTAFGRGLETLGIDRLVDNVKGLLDFGGGLEVAAETAAASVDAFGGALDAAIAGIRPVAADAPPTRGGLPAAAATVAAAEETRRFAEKLARESKTEFMAEAKALKSTFSYQAQNLRDIITEGVSSLTGSIGSMYRNASQAFAAAGVWGAVASVVVDLLARSKAGQVMSAKIDAFVQEFADALGEILWLLMPFLDMLLNMLRRLIPGLIAGIRALVPAFMLFFTIVKYVVATIATGVQIIVSTLTGILDSILETIARVVSLFDEEAAASIRARKTNEGWGWGTWAADVEAAGNFFMDATFDMAASSVYIGREFERLGDSARDASESLSNIPSGFSVERWRYRSGDPESGAMPGTLDTIGRRDGGAGAGAGTVINIGTIGLPGVDDVDSFVQEMESRSRTDAMARMGSPVTGIGRFVFGGT